MDSGGLDPAEIVALIRGEHGDPFAALGPHRTEPGPATRREAGVWLRALRPGALAVAVELGPDHACSVALEQIDPAGLFAIWIAQAELDALVGPIEPGDPAGPLGAYRLAVDYPHGHREIVDDPYRFGFGLGELDRYLLGEGTHLRPWTVLGAHPRVRDGIAGVRFAIWAPHARAVAVVGDFNGWNPAHHPMRLHPSVGVWELFVPGVAVGAVYKYAVRTAYPPDDPAAVPVDLSGHLPLDRHDKADPYAFAAELRPGTASLVAALPEPHPDEADRQQRRIEVNDPSAPISIYEVHLGSWRRGDDNRFYDWARLAAELPAYVAGLGFTHVELLPIAEHPFDGSWGYQVTGYYAPTARFGPGSGFAEFVAACHAHGLAVLLDWVPAHFPDDAHALRELDGTALYEYADPREGKHEDWDTLIFNFGRTEVRNFLVGNALYWLEVWGVDGLRVDAVASMLYRDYSRPADAWVPNAAGGRENLEAISLLQRVNAVISAEAPGAATVAEESTSWPGVTAPLHSELRSSRDPAPSCDPSGRHSALATDAAPDPSPDAPAVVPLGFAYKWNLGWMHDTLAYMSEDPIFRKHHHERLTFGILYGFSERYVLALSHDEVVHEKRSLLGRMPGDRWQRFANLRAYYGFMWGHPGKKLLFMGGEFGQEREWDHDRGLDWDLLDPAPGDPDRPEPSPEAGVNEHAGVQALVAELNAVYRGHPALHALDCDPAGFEWLVVDDREHSVIAFLRRGSEPDQQLIVVCNFTPLPRVGYRVGLPEPAPGLSDDAWAVVLDTDARRWGGSGYRDLAGAPAIAEVEAVPSDGRERSLSLVLPPLATIMLIPA